MTTQYSVAHGQCLEGFIITSTPHELVWDGRYVLSPLVGVSEVLPTQQQYTVYKYAE